MTQIAATGNICPRYEHGIQLLGKRWTGLLLYALMEGPRRFCELTATVEGLSDRVLSDRLRELEVEGVVERVVYPQIPVRVEYKLTEKGQALPDRRSFERLSPRRRCRLALVSWRAALPGWTVYRARRVGRRE